MTHIIQGDFPYKKHNRPSGDFFRTVAEAKAAGWDENQIWSVVEGDETLYGKNVWVYGPSHHHINVLGFTATKERHDGETYFEETF